MRLTRRTALKFAGLIALAAHGWDQAPVRAMIPGPKGYGADPDLLKRPVTWRRTLEGEHLEMLAVLIDIVLPAEPPYPSAGALGVHEFLDEWVSAPYPRMQADRTLILEGLAKLDSVMRRTHGVPFAKADLSEQASLFDQFCGNEETVGFSRRLIELTCAGYYTTRAGHAAIGYVGNVPLASFPAPAPEILRHLDKALNELVEPAREK